jgi:hypothetical protein
MAATVSYLFPSADGILVIAMLGVDASGDRPQPASIRNGARRNAGLHALTVLARGNIKNPSAKRNQPLLRTPGTLNGTELTGHGLPIGSQRIPQTWDKLKRIG